MMDNQWHTSSTTKPPLHQQVLVELRDGPGQVCDVACYVGPQQIDGGGMEDRWILADVHLDTRQILRWAFIYPLPPKNELGIRDALLREAAEELHGAASFYAEQGISDGYRDCVQLARRIEDIIPQSPHGPQSDSRG